MSVAAPRATLLRLAAAGPAPAARAGCLLLAAAGYRLARERRRAARERIRSCLPALPPTAIRQVVRAAFALPLVAGHAAAAWPRRDPVAACRDLELLGWDRLGAVAADRAVLLCSPPGSAGLAAWALALYAAAPALLSSSHHDDAWRLAAEGLARHRGCVPVATVDPARRLLGSGARLAVPLAPAAGRTAAPFFGRPCGLAGEAATLAAAHGAGVVPLFAAPVGPGRWRIEVAAPLAPDPDPVRLAAHCLSAVEEAVRRQPAAWPWLLDPWREA